MEINSNGRESFWNKLYICRFIDPFYSITEFL